MELSPNVIISLVESMHSTVVDSYEVTSILHIQINHDKATYNNCRKIDYIKLQQD